MATQLLCPTLSRSKIKNWIKSGLCVLFTKKGIEPFVYDEIQQFQQKCLNDICNNNGLAAGTTCSSCCTENVVVCPTNRICNARRGKCSFHRNSATQYLPSGCPSKICHNFKSEIQNAHRFHGPSYKNTDATEWCTNPWEVAKCFMPPDSYKDVTSAAETDFNGISSVIINHKAFHSKVHDDLGKENNIFHKAREAGKAVRQSSYFGVEDGDLQYYFSTFQRLLSDSGYLATNSSSQNARENLSQLQSDTLVLRIEDIRKVLDDFGKVGENELNTENHEHAKDSVKKLELIKIIKSCVSAFETQGKLSMSDLDKAIDSAIDEIEIKTNKSIIKMQSGAVSELGFTANRHEMVIYSRVNRVQEMKELKIMTEEDINRKGKEDVQKMEKEVDNGEKRISLETDNTKRKIKEETGLEVKRLKTDVRAGAQPFETDSDVTKVASKSKHAVKQIEEIRDEGAKDYRTETKSRMENFVQVTKDIAKQTEVADVEIADVEVETISSKSAEVFSKKQETLTVANEDEKNRTDLPSDSDLAKIVKAIGINWELLGPHLDLRTAEIDHIKMDNDTTEKQIHKMLHVWRQDQGLNGTKQKLFSAFSNELSTYIDWEALEQSFPDASKYKPKEKNKHTRSQAEQDYEERKTRK
ncbi:uncharacterized protein LOC123540141 isoform X2 [Mercenaria mercenaria]|uniref:uncharacterized protein LOC123540141 isoform X2 n=1 Tax=Mercenaria mercenaria TaxID=6596 RepID=UPI00234F8CD8|nr:uncharacterized protein LOC123540141 isoform X2 [Mercenaria mercenaria]